MLPGQLQVFLFKMATESTPGTSRSVLKQTVLTWEAELHEVFDFVEDESGLRIVKAVCKVCRKHCDKLESQYRGKIWKDVETYGKCGTSCLLKPNLLRHSSSEGHRKCQEMETGEPINKKQKTITAAFGSARNLAKNALRPLICACIYLGRKEKPYDQYADFLETCFEMGLDITTAFSNEKAAKVFNHIVAEQMTENLRNTVRNSNFVSWLIDGSAAAKRRLTYEAELLYIRTASGLIPNCELFKFISMEQYAVVNAQNLYHAVLKELLALNDKSFEEESLYTKKVYEVETESLEKKYRETDLSRKIIGVAADGASINFGRKKGLVTQYQAIAPWTVPVHCMSHRLELAANEALKDVFGEINDFLQEMHLHFRNSHKEWCILLKLAAEMGLQVLTQTKSYGTRFLPHVTRTLNALRYNWLIYVFHFSNVKASNEDKLLAAKAAAWLKKLLDFRFLAKCRVYEDVLQHLQLTANVFQTDDARSMADAVRACKTLQAEQELLLEEPGEAESDLWDRVDQGEPASESESSHLGARTRQANPSSATVCKKIKLSVKVKRNSDQEGDSSKSKLMDSDFEEPIVVTNVVSKDSISDTRKQAIRSLQTAQSERFKEFENSPDVLSKIKFVDITMWPDGLKELSVFAVDDIKALLERFQVPLANAGLDSEIALLQEFRTFKMFFGPRIQSGELKKSPREFWPWAFTNNELKYKNFFLLVELVLCIPFSTAVVERGFSAVRRILTDWRASLSQKLVQDCLHFSTRKPQLADTRYRSQLVSSACDTFLSTTEQQNALDGLGTLTKRRINKILSGLQQRVPVETQPNATSSEIGGSSSITSLPSRSDESESEDGHTMLSSDEDIEILHSE